jgi:hypothetical protein
VVFTVPHELNVLALENPAVSYDLLFTASAQTLLQLAADPTRKIWMSYSPSCGNVKRVIMPPRAPIGIPGS